MENASKALIIAAGVLIAILLIIVGIRILNSTTGIQDSVDELADEMTYRAIWTNINMFLDRIDYKDNNAFYVALNSKYNGRIITSIQAKELCMLIMERNEMVFGNINTKGSIRLPTSTGDITCPEGSTKEEVLSQIKNGNTYKVIFFYRPTEGTYAYAVRFYKQ